MSGLRKSKRTSFDVDDEWVLVEFVEDHQVYRSTEKRVLDCVKEPDLFNVRWKDGRMYPAKILKRGKVLPVTSSNQDCDADGNQECKTNIVNKKKNTSYIHNSNNNDSARCSVTNLNIKDQVMCADAKQPTESIAIHAGNLDVNPFKIATYPAVLPDSVIYTQLPKLGGEGDECLSAVSSSVDDTSGDETYSPESASAIHTESDDGDEPSNRKQRRARKGTVKKTPWTTEERQAVMQYLISFISEGRVPGKMECEKCKKSTGDKLARRDWKSIKFCVKNEIVKIRKN